MSAASESSAVRRQWSQRCLDFVQAAGIPVSTETGVNGFLPHLVVRAGGLVVDLEHVFPGDILHEAGHLALIPSRWRPLADGDLSEATGAMFDWLDQNPQGLTQYPEDPTCRAILQSSDDEATAWQFAAACAIDLPEQWLFPADAYEGEGLDVLAALKGNQHPGIHGLQAANRTRVRPGPWKAELPVYPGLMRWLAD